MKKIILPFLILITLVACNNTEPQSNTGETKADTLQNEVIKIHDIAMPKSMKIPDLQKRMQAMLDSIGKLPAKAREMAVPLKTKLNETLSELSEAETAMNKWMVEFKLDSAKNNFQQRIQYLTDEKLKVGKVKDVVLNSLAKADSLLKAKP